MKKTMSQWKNIQPSFSTIAVSGQSSITPQWPFDTLTFAWAGVTTNATTRTVTITRWDVSKVGTPVNNQIAVWTGDWTLEWEPDLTYDASLQALVVGSGNFSSRLIRWPHATGTGAGWALTLNWWDWWPTSWAWGNFTMRGWLSAWASGSGGQVSLSGWSSVNWNGGGAFCNGWSSTNGNGWFVSISSWTWNLTTWTWGALQLIAWNWFVKGTFSLRQRQWLYMFASDGTSTAANQAILNFAAINTAAKTFTFPNVTGTVDLVRTWYTFATLPAAPVVWDRAYITDALAPAFLAPVAWWGAVVCPVFYDWAAWVAF